MMKKLKWITIVALIFVLAYISYRSARPSLVVKFNGVYQSNTSVILIRDGVSESIELDENGSYELNYSDVGDLLIIMINNHGPTISREFNPTLGTYEEIGIGENIFDITRKVEPEKNFRWKDKNYGKRDRDIEKRLEKIQFGHIEFTDDTTLRQALNFLALRLRESDPPSPLSAKLVECRKGLPDEIKQKIIGKLKLKEVSFAEALDVLFLRVGLTWEIVNGELVVEEIKREGNAEVQLKLDRIMLENVEFTEDTTMREAINFMRLRARELDVGEPGHENPPANRGLSFVFRDRVVKPAPAKEDGGDFLDKDIAGERRIGKVLIYHVSLREALTILCRRGGIQWHVGEFRVIFSNRED